MPPQTTRQNFQGGNPPINSPMAPPVSPFLALLPKKYWHLRKEFFTYTVQNGRIVLAASAQKVLTPIQINADSDFLLMAVTGTVFANDGTTTVANPPFLVQLQDGSSSQFIQNDQVHWEATVGTAKEPFYLPYPRLLGRASTFNIQLTNVSATERWVYPAFHGFKIYPTPAEA